MWTIQLGYLGLVFAGCYLMIPLYKMFCQKVGLEGDLKQKQFEDLKDKIQNVNKHRKIQVYFDAVVDPKLDWEFDSMQDHVVVHPGETALAFYKAINHQNKPMIGIATYSVYPEFASNYFSKVQCFCFNQQMLNPEEEVELPLYFYLEPEFAEDEKLTGVKTIRILYKFYPCKEQEIAEILHEQNIKNTQQKIFLYKKRIEKNLEQQKLLEIQEDLLIQEKHLKALMEFGPEENIPKIKLEQINYQFY